MNIKQRFVGNTELKIDILGLGCAPLGGNFVDLSYEDGTKIINTALHSGMSYFDTAACHFCSTNSRTAILRYITLRF